MPENRRWRSAWIRLFTRKFRTKTTRWLGVSVKRKGELYLDLSRAATLRDAVYWLQIFFSAGIATLGLVLNSPAVIIGAMLISPLMSPILAAGLAFATGDLILGLRAITKLVLSCALAIGFAVILVVLLPFREMTTEIAARTQPNTLDLLIALFSGAVGSIATCREVKGVVTSIPGVAIAVALMPPLCVVGYGIGLALIFDAPTGMRVGGGGGLLFLTNLVAITLTAMLVLLALRIDTPQVLKKSARWEQTDRESRFLISVLQRFARVDRARKIHSVTLRFLMILIPLALIMIPLTRAFSQLQTEINQKQRENKIRNVVTDLWQSEFQTNADGAERSTIDQLTVTERENVLSVYLRVFDDRPYTVAEKSEYSAMIARQLQRPPSDIRVQLVEVPTTSLLDQMREREQKTAPPSAEEIQANLRQQAENALQGIALPPDFQLLDKRVVTGAVEPLHVSLVYLGDTDLQPAMQTQIAGQISSKLNSTGAKIRMERIPTDPGNITFVRNRAELPILGILQLDFVGRILRENQQLVLSVTDQRQRGETPVLSDARFKAIADYLATRWQIDRQRLQNAVPSETTANDKGTQLEFSVTGDPATPATNAEPAPPPATTEQETAVN